MGGLRLILIGVVVWLLVRAAQRYLAGDGGRGGSRGRREAVERMQKCAQCELHVPASDAIEVGGRTFCSQAHAEAFARSREEDGDG